MIVHDVHRSTNGFVEIDRYEHHLIDDSEPICIEVYDESSADGFTTSACFWVDPETARAMAKSLLRAAGDG